MTLKKCNIYIYLHTRQPEFDLMKKQNIVENSVRIFKIHLNDGKYLTSPDEVSESDEISPLSDSATETFLPRKRWLGKTIIGIVSVLESVSEAPKSDIMLKHLIII